MRKQALLHGANMEGILLREVSQTAKDKYRIISLVGGIYKSQLIEAESDMAVGSRRGSGKRGDVGYRVKAFSDEMTKFWGPEGQRGDGSDCCILHPKTASTGAGPHTGLGGQTDP